MCWADELLADEEWESAQSWTGSWPVAWEEFLVCGLRFAMPRPGCFPGMGSWWGRSVIPAAVPCSTWSLLLFPAPPGLLEVPFGALVIN